MAASDLDSAVAVLDAAIATAECHNERWWLPEVLRLRGLTAPQPERRPYFETALRLARDQGNRLLERRVNESLTSLASRSGKF
jgi:hypothetical protein